MTFQTMGSVFHNIVLPGKFYRLDSDFLGVCIYFARACEKIWIEGVGVYIRIIIRFILIYK